LQNKYHSVKHHPECNHIGVTLVAVTVWHYRLFNEDRTDENVYECQHDRQQLHEVPLLSFVYIPCKLPHLQELQAKKEDVHHDHRDQAPEGQGSIVSIELDREGKHHQQDVHYTKGSDDLDSVDELAVGQHL
jgi:hypothetical protein